jgi:hypothetical protein
LNLVAPKLKAVVSTNNCGMVKNRSYDHVWKGKIGFVDFG